MNLEVLKKLSRKHWLIIVGVVSVAFAALFIYLLSGSLARLGPDEEVPAWLRAEGDGESLYAQIAAANEATAKENAFAAGGKQKQDLLDSMKSDITAARKRLPTEAQKAEVRQLIEDLGRQVGTGKGALSVRSVSIREVAAAGGRGATNDYKTIEYMTAVSADIDGIIQFINLIERNDRFMTVEGIQITPGGVALSTETSRIEAKPHAAQLRIVTYIDASGGQIGRGK